MSGRAANDPAACIQSSDMRRIVREALAGGWVWDGFTASGHARICWPSTGQTLSFGTTPGVASWKSLATDIKRVSGVEVWRKGNRRHSRKAFRPSGFDLDRAARETRAWRRENAARIDELTDGRFRLIEDCKRRAAGGRGRRIGIPAQLTKIAELEQELSLLGQHVEPFDPMTLAEIPEARHA